MLLNKTGSQCRTSLPRDASPKRVFIPPSSGPAVSAISAISAPPPPSPRHVRRPCNVNLHNTATRADSTIDDRPYIGHISSRSYPQLGYAFTLCSGSASFLSGYWSSATALASCEGPVAQHAYGPWMTYSPQLSPLLPIYTTRANDVVQSVAWD